MTTSDRSCLISVNPEPLSRIADVVMFLYRDDYYNEDSEKKNIAEVIIAKHRGGSTGTVDLGWLGSYTKFVNLRKKISTQ